MRRCCEKHECRPAVCYLATDRRRKRRMKIGCFVIYKVEKERERWEDMGTGRQGEKVWRDQQTWDGP